jgi:hypothetical protein
MNYFLLEPWFFKKKSRFAIFIGHYKIYLPNFTVGIFGIRLTKLLKVCLINSVGYQTKGSEYVLAG